MARCYHIICCKDRWDPLRKMAAIFSFSLCTFAVLSTYTVTTSTLESVDRTFSPSTHLACTCQDGYYKHESVMLHVPRGFCANFTSSTGTSNNSNNSNNEQHTSLSLDMSSGTLGQSSGKNSALHPVSLSMCRSCSPGCLTCSGPNKKDCTACKKDFFLLVDNEDFTRSIRSLDKTNDNGPSNNSIPRACGNASDSGVSGKHKYNTSCQEVGEDIEGLDISLTLNGSHTKKSRINNDLELDIVLSQEELLYSTDAPKSPSTAKQLATPTAPTNLMTTFDDASGETPESPEVMVKLNTTLNDGSSKTRIFDCVTRCPWGMFADDEDKTCKSCHLECDGCEDLGANRCLRCKNFLLGNFCVQHCPEGYKSVEANVCQKDEQVVSGVPYSFYIVTPLVAIMIIVMCVMVSLRRRHKCASKCSRLSTGLRIGVLRGIFNEQRNQSACQDGHEGHQKCYLKKGRLPEFLTLKPFQGEQPKLGSVNVYIDNPLTKKGSEALGNYSHHSDIDDDKDDDDYDYEDDDGPLYETPGRGSPASFQGRQVTTDAKHYLTPCSIGTLDSRKNYTLGSGCSCKSLDSMHSSRTNNNSSLANAAHNIQTTQEDEETPTASDDSSSCAIKSGISEGIKWEICNEMKHMEVPFFDAPPLPERNTPSVAKPVLDPIYSNIDDEIL